MKNTGFYLPCSFNPKKKIYIEKPFVSGGMGILGTNETIRLAFLMNLHRKVKQAHRERNLPLLKETLNLISAYGGLRSTSIPVAVSKLGGLGTTSIIASDLALEDLLKELKFRNKYSQAKKYLSRKDYQRLKAYQGKITYRQAVAEEVRLAKKHSGVKPRGGHRKGAWHPRCFTHATFRGGKPIAVNIMVALQKHIEDSILGSLDGKADILDFGAGLMFKFSEAILNHPHFKKVAIEIMTSSVKGFRAMHKKYQQIGLQISTFAVEGPLAGGHSGLPNLNAINNPKNSLENIILDINEYMDSEEYEKTNKLNPGYKIPLIVAGGIRTREQAQYFLKLPNVVAVQGATLLTCTQESNHVLEFKRMVLQGGETTVLTLKENPPGSPCGGDEHNYPFRVFTNSPILQKRKANLSNMKPSCPYGYVTVKDKKTGLFTFCPAQYSIIKNFCICDHLLAKTIFSYLYPKKYKQENQIYTIGANMPDGRLVPFSRGKYSEFPTVKEIMEYLLK